MRNAITINQQRLMDEINELATYSDAPQPAVTRILFTPTEGAARQYIRDLMLDAGLLLREDAVGNIFACWQGSDATLPPVATGSHIDAIPHSGRYDGTIGVIGAIEAVRALRQSGFEPRRTIEIIMFTAEEPTRFGIGCLGSRALAGALSPQQLRALADEAGQPFDDIRHAAGYTAPLEGVQLKKGAYSGFVELHIEQGPRLERDNIDIGLVNAIAAPATLRVVITGDGGHAGTVLMPQRKDALSAAAEVILAVEKAAKESKSQDSVATVGLCQVHPGAVNSIPSRVTMEIDIRDISLHVRDGMVASVAAKVHEVVERRDLSATIKVLNADSPAIADDDILKAMTQATQALGYSYRKLVSRAYHDALFMAQICPSSMIFVPSKQGYSHRPDEYTAPDEIERGVAVLAETLARLAL